MRIIFAMILFSLAVVLTTQRAATQVTYDGCYVGNGYPVASVMAPGLNDIASATIYQGQPVILYNPNVLAMASPQTRTFFYYHECAHHVRGHTLGSMHPLMVEQDADCWAIQNLVGSGQFQSYDVNAVQNDLANFSSGDWTHLPGPQRAINLYGCLGW